jgi:hypothetical protein
VGNGQFKETLTLKEDLWNEALSLLKPAIKGDEAAKKKLAELKTKCLAIADLYDWVESSGKRGGEVKAP